MTWLAALACAVVALIQVPVSAQPAPPAPWREVIPASPGSQYVWIKGHWRWNGYKYVWVHGYWKTIPTGYTHWVPGHYGPRGYWVEGHWAR